MADEWIVVWSQALYRAGLCPGLSRCTGASQLWRALAARETTALTLSERRHARRLQQRPVERHEGETHVQTP